MKYLATLNNPRAAQAFVDYMALKSIEISIKPVDQAQVELSVDESSYEVALDEVNRFTQNPQHKRYLDASWQRNADNNPLSYKTSGPSVIKSWFGKGGWVTHVVVALCVAIYILAHFTPIYEYLAFPSAISQTNGEIWRWLTPAFMHFGGLHIAFNLLWWWMLGAKLEKQFDATFLLLFLVFSAVISNYAQFIITGTNNFGGLSGVVYGLMGFCWLYGRLKPQQAVQLSDGLFGFCLVWLVFGYTDIGPISFANHAHLSGLLSGLGFAFVWGKRG
jgi:GlpG protein